VPKRVTNFDEIAQEFERRTHRIIWCTMATVNREGRPRTRILHPLWEGPIGWIATGRTSPKADDIDHNPYVSVSYWDQEHEQVYVDARAEWEEDLDEKERIWKLFGTLEPPLGYDLGSFWGSVTDPDYGLLKLIPWRIELFALSELFRGKQPDVWVPKGWDR
jgi:general stress protein 26